MCVCVCVCVCMCVCMCLCVCACARSRAFYQLLMYMVTKIVVIFLSFSVPVFTHYMFRIVMFCVNFAVWRACYTTVTWVKNSPPSPLLDLEQYCEFLRYFSNSLCYVRICLLVA